MLFLESEKVEREKPEWSSKPLLNFDEFENRNSVTKMSKSSKKHEQVLQTLTASSGPMSANEIWERLSSTKGRQSIGIATVYRSLKRGVDEGQLISVELESGSIRYELANLDHHHHFLCSDCSRAFDVEGCVRNLEKLLPSGFEMTKHEILLYGRCADCRAA